MILENTFLAPWSSPQSLPLSAMSSLRWRRCLSIADISAASFPIYEIGIQAIKSDEAVLFLLIWLVFAFYTTIPGLLLTTGRLVWAFSRDNGLPNSAYFNRISEKYQVPVQAHIVTCVCCMTYGLIYVGSTYGFNVILSTTIAAAFISYSVPQGLLLVSDRSVLPPRHFKLGKFVGGFANLFSVVFTMVYCVLLTFPRTIPTTPMGMSYVSVVLVGLLCFIALLWFVAGKRKTFTGPAIQMELLEGINAVIVDDRSKTDVKC